MNNAIAAALSNVTLGPAVTVRNLTMIPLLKHRAPEHPAPQHPSAPAPLSTSEHPSAPFSTPNYVLLDDALARGAMEITEVSEQGSVPELLVVNRGPSPVLIIDGEELVGAKQNRVVNLTILVPAAATLKIPVSCVEAGRWRSRSRGFSSAPRTQYASGRAKRMKHVTVNLSMSGVPMSDQSDVWAHIAEKSERLGSHSPTSAMEAMYVDNAESIDMYVDGCRPIDAQVGALFAVNGIVIGFDLFDRPSTLDRMLPKLVRSVAVDALDRGMRSASDVDPTHLEPLAQRFVATAAAIPQRTAKALGDGDDVRLDGSGITGAALVMDASVLHFAAFSA